MCVRGCVCQRVRMLEGVCHYLPGHCFSDVDDEGPLALTVGPEHWLAREGRGEGRGSAGG